MPLSTLQTSGVSWLLTGQLGANLGPRRVVVSDSPFTVGRSAGASLTLPCLTVSGKHAELRIEDGQLIVRDLGSTNGTFVNGARVTGETTLAAGDLLQLAEAVFRVGVERGCADSKTIAGDSTDQALALIQFDKLISDRAVLPHFQPIVEMATERTIGFEVLGRSQLFGLGTPHAMFSAAAILDLESELSCMLRDEGVRSAMELPAHPLVFLNTHPAELQDPSRLEVSLRKLHEAAPQMSLVLEIHEAAATSVAQMRELRLVLNDLGMKLAYDDFGAGQARLAELGDAPPDYLKFDIQLIRNVDGASAERQRMLESLVRIAADLGILSLAEGIETSSEHEACKRLGFVYGQGYRYGVPATASTFIGGASRVTPLLSLGPRLSESYP